MRVYLDTNVFYHLVNLNGGLMLTDRECLLRKIRDGSLEVVFSYLNLSEVGRRVLEDRETYPRLVEAIREFSSITRLVKHLPQLLEEEWRAYVSRGRSLSPFYAEKTARALLEGLDVSKLEELAQVAEDDEAQRQGFVEGLIQLRDAGRTAEGKPTTNTPVQELLRERLEQAFRYQASRTGRALDLSLRGLEDVRLMRGAFGLSQAVSAYAVRVETNPTTPRIEGQDSRDLQHAGLAAASADVFVTNDRRFRNILLAGGFDAVPVLTIDEFLTNLGCRN